MSKINNEKDAYSIQSRFISLTFLIFFTLVIYVGWKTTELSTRNMQTNLTYDTNNIVQSIDNILYRVEDKLKIVGNIIINQKTEDNYQQILGLLKITNNELQKENNFIESIEWNDHNHLARVNNTTILQTPIDLSYKSYIQQISTKSFTLFFDKIISNHNIITAAIGVKNEADKFIGSISINFNINNIEQHINNSMQSSKKEYALVNALNKQIILYSMNFNNKNYSRLMQETQQTNLSADTHKFKKIDNQNYIVKKFNNIPFLLILEEKQNPLESKQYIEALSLYKLELLYALLTISVLIYLLYLYIVSPFLVVTNLAIAISNKDPSINIQNPLNCREIYIIASTLNKAKSFLEVERELTTALSEANNKLSINNLRVENEVTERTKELEKHLISKNTLFNQMNSEIKTPLQAVSSIANNLVSYWSELTDPMRFELAHQIHYSSSKLTSLVHNLLEMAHLSNEKINLVLIKFDMVEVVEEIITECKALYLHKKNISIAFNYESNPIYVVADREKIAQVIRNLFVHAIKNSPNNSAIAAKILITDISYNKEKRKAAHFIIHDLDPKKEEELAAIFASSDDSTDTSILGLKICYKIILAHYGKMWVVDNKDGGNTFNFILPSSAIDTLETKNHNLPLYKDLSFDQPNILLIDDEEACLGSMELLLYNTPYNLIKCNSGQEGLKYLKNNYKHISLVMLDLMMPDIYGLNVLAQIKANPKLAKIPVMLQTGISDEAEVLKAFNMGISCFIRKPYNKATLLNEIKKTLKLLDLNNQIDVN